MRTYYLALIVLWLLWECDLNFFPAAATSVKPNLFELEYAPPPISAAADTVSCIAAVPSCPADFKVRTFRSED